MDRITNKGHQRLPTPNPSEEGLHVLQGFAAAQLILELQNLRVNTEGVNPQTNKKPSWVGLGVGPRMAQT